jgi:hypothetical protein
MAVPNVRLMTQLGPAAIINGMPKRHHPTDDVTAETAEVGRVKRF